MNIRTDPITNRPALLLATFALLLTVVGWRPVSAQELPRIFVTPDVVVGGQSVTIRGLDFTPGGYAGLILWDGVWTETLTIPDGGDFSVQFRIPPTANAGKHEVSVCAADARFQCFTGEFAQTAVAPVEVTAPAPIRICKETVDPCEPHTKAIVHDITTGKDFDVDDEGYILDREAIGEGDLLWAAAVNSTTTSYRVLATSGDPVEVIDKFFNGDPAEMRIPVGLDDPLILFDLDVSAEWYVQGDPQYAAWLEGALIDAGRYLYEFTEGQMTLGEIAVSQSMDGWADADMRLLANNSLRPNAEIGGMVEMEVVDPLSEVTYVPGQVYMGSYWNRYAVPPNQPVTVGGNVVPPETLVDDWATAFAHELGHYLLFLYDTYRDADGNDSAEIAALCTGSAMGDVYQSNNHAFIADPGEWKAKCSATEAYARHRGFGEWEIIAAAYPWITPPAGPSSQPDVAPVNMTEVFFLAPSTSPGAPAPSQIFDLNYQDGELSSGEARVFLYRNDRVIEQGKPAAGINQASLVGAQIDDRLCVYDVNDYAQADDSPRHQFGCEPIQPGDAVLDMTKDLSWRPVILLTQVATDTLTISATLPVGGARIDTLQVRVYPEYETGYEPVELVQDVGGVYHAQLIFTDTVPPAYVQIWSDDAVIGMATRRETIADRGTGGGGLFGFARRFGGAFIYSSDGKASFRVDGDLELKDGESIAWQSMPGTPRLPVDKRISGQSYRLTAYPESLVDTGTVEIEFEALADSPSRSIRSSSVRSSSGGQTAEPVVHFYDGKSWAALTTTIGQPSTAQDGVQIASAPSMGVGVYAVLADRDVETIWLPAILGP